MPAQNMLVLFGSVLICDKKKRVQQIQIQIVWPVHCTMHFHLIEPHFDVLIQAQNQLKFSQSRRKEPKLADEAIKLH